MLAFIDESGDVGLKLSEGSSEYFVIALVLFDEYEEAIACDRHIEQLKKELGIHNNGEFKFSNLNLEKRTAFFKALLKHSFFYFGVVINKDINKLYGDDFKEKESFYKYTCNLVFQNAKPYLKDATVLIDGSGSRKFKRQFQTYLKRKMGGGIIKKIKIQQSHTNNLIQLADMTAGAIHRSFTDKKDKNIYRDIFGAKEMHVQVWPR